MILYYFVDREMINATHIMEKNKDIQQAIEHHIEKNLRYLMLIMPLGEVIIISPSFRFESPMCRRILERNREFQDQGYIAQYMEEESEYEFKEKKAERYKRVMDISGDYREAYGKNDTFRLVNQAWMRKVKKKEAIGEGSRSIFEKILRKKGRRYKVEDKQMEEIIKLIRDSGEKAFLWEAVDNNLQQNNIETKIIQLLKIRTEMNESYLQAFNNQGIEIPYNDLVMGVGNDTNSIYDMWKIAQIFKGLELDLWIDLVTDKDIIYAHENVDFQNAMEIVRKGLKEERSVLDICNEVRETYDLGKILGKGGTEMSDMLEYVQEGTLKILHISDLHLCEMKKMEGYLFYLKLDLERQLKVNKIDYVIISGDICDRPKKEQYEIALEFCRRLVENLEIDKEKVIVVPGNHDCDRIVSKAAYDESTKSFCEEKRKRRFENYNNYFYKPFFDRDYVMEYDGQKDCCKDTTNKVYILGLNSSYLIDHIETKKSSINMKVIQEDEANWVTEDYVKLVVFHHPISGYAAIEDKTFLDTLTLLGYKACLHGHIHEATNENYSYDDKNGIRIIGAGTFGAVKEDRGDGIPLQYNLIELDIANKQGIVHTRKREKENGVWMADARWGDKGHKPKAYYTFDI